MNRRTVKLILRKENKIYFSDVLMSFKYKKQEL